MGIVQFVEIVQPHLDVSDALGDRILPAGPSPGPVRVPGSRTRDSLLGSYTLIRTHSGKSLGKVLEQSSSKPVSLHRARGTCDMEPSALRIAQVHVCMSLVRPRVLWANRLRRRGLRAEVSIS